MEATAMIAELADKARLAARTLIAASDGDRVEALNRIADELISTGKSTKPFLGISFDPAYTGNGARILTLTPGNAAERAGLTVGSIVKSIDGFKVNDAVTAIVRIRSHAPGDQIIMVVESPAGSSKTFNITLGSAPALP